MYVVGVIKLETLCFNSFFNNATSPVTSGSHHVNYSRAYIMFYVLLALRTHVASLFLCTTFVYCSVLSEARHVSGASCCTLLCRKKQLLEHRALYIVSSRSIETHARKSEVAIEHANGTAVTRELGIGCGRHYARC